MAKPPPVSSIAQVRLACVYANAHTDQLLRAIAGNNIRSYLTGEAEVDAAMFWWDASPRQRPLLRWILELSGPPGYREQIVLAAGQPAGSTGRLNWISRLRSSARRGLTKRSRGSSSRFSMPVQSVCPMDASPAETHGGHSRAFPSRSGLPLVVTGCASWSRRILYTVVRTPPPSSSSIPQPQSLAGRSSKPGGRVGRVTVPRWGSQASGRQQRCVPGSPMPFPTAFSVNIRNSPR